MNESIVALYCAFWFFMGFSFCFILTFITIKRLIKEGKLRYED